jgi:hypothetical protein
MSVRCKRIFNGPRSDATSNPWQWLENRLAPNTISLLGSLEWMPILAKVCWGPAI